MNQRIPALDGFRGCSALAVLFCHTATLHNGALGVDAFFALSGFLIGGVLLQEQRLPRFFLRRIARIWPLYAAVVLYVWLLGAAPFHWPFFTMTSNFVFPPRRAFFAGAHVWSVCVEEHAYLLLPALIAWVPRPRLPQALIAGSLVSVLCRLAFFHSEGWFYFTQCRLDGILLGALAAWIAVERPRWAGKLNHPLLYVAFGIIIAVRPGWSVMPYWQLLVTMTFAALVLVVADQNRVQPAPDPVFTQIVLFSSELGFRRTYGVELTGRSPLSNPYKTRTFRTGLNG